MGACGVRLAIDYAVLEQCMRGTVPLGPFFRDIVFCIVVASLQHAAAADASVSNAQAISDGLQGLESNNLLLRSAA